MAVILIAGTIPDLPPLYNGHEIHLISNLSKLWATIALLRPSVIILNDNTVSFNARKFCRDSKQNKTTQHIAIIIITEDPEISSRADANIQRPLDTQTFQSIIQKMMQQLSSE